MVRTIQTLPSHRWQQTRFDVEAREDSHKKGAQMDHDALAYETGEHVLTGTS